MIFESFIAIHVSLIERAGSLINLVFQSFIAIHFSIIETKSITMSPRRFHFVSILVKTNGRLMITHELLVGSEHFKNNYSNVKAQELDVLPF